MIFSLDLNTTKESMSRTDAGREFHVDGTAVLKAHSPKDVLLNGVHGSGTDAKRSDCKPPVMVSSISGFLRLPVSFQNAL